MTNHYIERKHPDGTVDYLNTVTVELGHVHRVRWHVSRERATTWPDISEAKLVQRALGKLKSFDNIAYAYSVCELS